MVLVGDQIGDVPGQEIQDLSCQMAGLVNSNSRLHFKSQVLGAEAYTSRRFSCKNK